MTFQKIKYSNLNAKQKEIYNFQKLSSILADYGFHCHKLSDDWNGADFIAQHFESKETIYVQLKSRITIDKKYDQSPLDIWIAFPSDGNWYLLPHSELKKSILSIAPSWFERNSWQENGKVSTKRSVKITQALDKWKL